MSVEQFFLRRNKRGCGSARLCRERVGPVHNSHRDRGASMNCTIDWMPANGMAFSAETGSGHLLLMDGAPDGGGRNLAPRPMETVLARTGGCTASDVVLILQRGRQ